MHVIPSYLSPVLHTSAYKLREWCYPLLGWVFLHQLMQYKYSPIDVSIGQTDLDIPSLKKKITLP